MIIKDMEKLWINLNILRTKKAYTVHVKTLLMMHLILSMTKR